jgi:hypothetical protein
VEQARQYSFDFLAWKRVYQLKKHLLAHNRSTCPRDGTPFTRAHLGRSNRRAFFCTVCQALLLLPGHEVVASNPSPARTRDPATWRRGAKPLASAAVATKKVATKKVATKKAATTATKKAAPKKAATKKIATKKIATTKAAARRAR